LTHFIYTAIVVQALHKMVQQSQERNRQVVRAPRGWGSQNFYKLAYEDGKIVRPAGLTPPGDTTGTYFCKWLS